jgi:two-component system, cell cycle sensor histidine kinase and response regulator CckA
MMMRNPSAPGTHDARILLVDDEKFLLELIREILEEGGYTVTALTDSVAAFHRFAASPLEFDLVISDEKMPGLSGTDLSRQILEIRPNLPVILYTDYPDAAAVKRARAMGVRAIVGKSSNMNLLITHIRHLLGA